MTTSTEELDSVQDEGESELIGNEHLLEKLRELESIRALRGVSSRGVKDGGVGHPPRARVKEDHKNTMVDTVYQGAGYNTKKGFINVDVSQGARPLRHMSREESEAHVVGLFLAQMYSLRKGMEIFGEKAEQATMTELTQIDDFETYKPLHKHELSEQDRRDALESMIKVTESGLMRKVIARSKVGWWPMAASRDPMKDMRSPMGNLQQPGQTASP